MAAPAISQTVPEAILSYFKTNASRWNLQPSDVASVEVMSTASSKAPGTKHFYVRQLVNGIPVSNGLATVTIKDNKVVHVASRLKSLSNVETAPASTDKNAAIAAAASALGIPQPASVDAQLVYTADASGKLRLAWDMNIPTSDHEHWWSLRVAASNQEILELGDWVQHCDFDHCTEHHSKTAAPVAETASALLMPPPPGADQYLVYALPVESPSHGNRSLVINPSDANASPFGWHDDNGIMGDEYTITRGNNVYASEDINDDDEPGYSPDGFGPLDFDFPYDSLMGVQGNLDAVITNLFYMNNMMHDIWYQYGFDEESGNFQSMNYTGDGLGDDFVYADAQDGSGSNNANFGTPPDGMNPRMQMYLWSDNNVEDLLSVNSPAPLAGDYVCATAGFGPPVPMVPITADFALVNDGIDEATDACEPLAPGSLDGKIALVRRGTCTFESKVEICQAAGAVAVIVMNNQPGAIISMGGSTGGAMIPSVMISMANGNTFENAINGGQTLNGTLVNPGDLTATDSDFDNGIIAHEYGHGISTRLTGGPESSDCLFNEDQMGEGWSDWFGLMITMEPGDAGDDIRGIGTYVTNEPTNGGGIRPAPYSTDFAINDFTYAATNNSNQISQPHGIGFVWATMLWDLNWALIDEYGWDPDVKYGTGGNNMAMALVIEGLKLQPCEPGFVDGRDAILAADELLYGGQNQCLIWEVFARRGLGFSADQGDTDDRTDQVEAFDVHPSCIEGAGLGENGFAAIKVYPNPAKDILNIDMTEYDNVETVRILDLQGKVLFETTHVAGPKLQVNIAHYRSGVYLVQLTDKSGAKAVQIVKH